MVCDSVVYDFKPEEGIRSSQIVFEAPCWLGIELFNSFVQNELNSYHLEQLVLYTGAISSLETSCFRT